MWRISTHSASLGVVSDPEPLRFRPEIQPSVRPQSGLRPSKLRASRWKTRINQNYVSRNEAGLEGQHRLATLRRTGTMSPRVIGAPDYHSCLPSLGVSFRACQTHAGADWCDRKPCSSRPPRIRWSSPVDVSPAFGTSIGPMLVL